MNHFRTFSLAPLVALVALGCSQPTGSNDSLDASSGDASIGADMAATFPDQGRDATVSVDQDGAGDADVALPVDAADASLVDMGPETLPAEDYCELSVEMFCSYYMRCGRMAADTMEECRATFLESCNEIYEPRYASYVERGMLELSRDGMQACEAHLADVACELQVFDLDLGCSDMWQGQVPRGGACAPGIGSFVCGSADVCTLDLDFCGTCKPAARVGEACGGEVRCEDLASCRDEVCVARGQHGDACDDASPCRVGANCQGGVCRSYDIVGVGEQCDQARRCQYKAECRGGVCVESALLGEPCIDRGCASGWCDDGVCAAFGAGGAACDSPMQCRSLQCEGGACAPVERACFE